MPFGGGGRLMANAILNFHFDYLHTSLNDSAWLSFVICFSRQTGRRQSSSPPCLGAACVWIWRWQVRARQIRNSETQQCAYDVQLCIVQCVSVRWDRSRWVIDTAGITSVHVARFSRISTRWWLGRCGLHWTRNSESESDICLNSKYVFWFYKELLFYYKIAEWL